MKDYYLSSNKIMFDNISIDEEFYYKILKSLLTNSIFFKRVKTKKIINRFNKSNITILSDDFFYKS